MLGCSTFSGLSALQSLNLTHDCYRLTDAAGYSSIYKGYQQCGVSTYQNGACHYCDTMDDCFGDVSWQSM